MARTELTSQLKSGLAFLWAQKRQPQAFKPAVRLWVVVMVKSASRAKIGGLCGGGARDFQQQFNAVSQIRIGAAQGRKFPHLRNALLDVGRRQSAGVYQRSDLGFAEIQGATGVVIADKRIGFSGVHCVFLMTRNQASGLLGEIVICL